jgi:hypothetical protein
MRIERLVYQDNPAHWLLSPTTFHSDVTVFVGYSPQDKRQILAAIDTLTRFARGQAPDELWGVSWEMQFVTHAGCYGWQGELSGRRFSLRDGLRKQAILKLFLPGAMQRGLAPFVLNESLTLNGRPLIERQGDSIRCNGRTLDDLKSSSQSVIALLQKVAEVRPAFEGLAAVVFCDDPADTLATLGKPLRELCNEFPTLPTIRASNLPTYAKFALVHENVPDVFRAIVRRVREHFPQIEDVGFDRVNRSRFTDVPALRLLEKGNDQWLGESKVTSKMLRDLLNLAAVELWPDDAVILIDDFENNLGVHCLEPVLEAARDDGRSLQFILTSDDMPLINRIGRERRKVVGYQGPTVFADDAAEFDFTRPRSAAIATAPGVRGQARRGPKATDITAEPEKLKKPISDLGSD